MKKLSIIICLYNTEKEYFDECLSSIFSSTLENFEVLIIDDGSDIDYSDIISKYDVRYVKTENRGVTDARLYGILISDGEYVCFADSDDTVSFNYHMPMVKKAQEAGADIVINDWAFHSHRARYFCKRDTTISDTFTYEDDEILRQYVKNEGRQHSYFTLWNKVFKRELLLKAKEQIDKLELPERRISYADDALINFFAYANAKKLTNVHTGYYFYRLHTSQSVNVTGKEKLKNQIYAMSYVLRSMSENVGGNRYADEIKEHIKKWSALMSRTHYSYALNKKYTDLYPYIVERYGVAKLKKSTMKDGQAYSDNEVLPSNFTDIDSSLREAYFTKWSFTADYDRSDKYVSSTIDYINNNTGKTVTYSKNAAFKIPRGVISFKNKFLHNYYIYTLGMLLFKKGSKTREFLKKKI